MAVTVELRLDERQAESVIVSVLLTPQSPSSQLGGVELHLQSPNGDALGPRMVLPIAGALTAPMRSTVQLRSNVPLERGARIVAAAWQGSQTVETSIPADARTELAHHAGPAKTLALSNDTQATFGALGDDDMQRLRNAWPWLADTGRPRVVEATADEEQASDVDDIIDDLELDEASSEWLRELLDDDSETDGH